MSVGSLDNSKPCMNIDAAILGNIGITNAVDLPKARLGDFLATRKLRSRCAPRVPRKSISANPATSRVVRNRPKVAEKLPKDPRAVDLAQFQPRLVKH